MGLLITYNFTGRRALANGCRKGTLRRAGEGERDFRQRALIDTLGILKGGGIQIKIARPLGS